MGVSINSNIAASTTLRHLDRATESLRRSFERLSSGLRINRASDDAAGLSISEGLRVQSRVGERGRLNINDGISALQIASGATQEIANILTRMAELAEQASSGSIGATQRKSLNKEYQALDKEIRRIAATTSFNGQHLLQGTMATTQSVTQLTNTAPAGVDAATATISSDGRYVTYKRFDTNTLEQLDTETGAVTTIFSSASVVDISASASGGKVAFVAAPAGQAQVYVWDRTSGQISQVTNSQGADFISDVTISADGSKVAFGTLTQYADGGTRSNTTGYSAGAWGLYTVDLASGIFDQVVAHAPGISFVSLNLSASGNFLAFTSNSNVLGSNGDGNSELFVQDLSVNGTGGLRQITSTNGAEQPIGKVTDTGEVYWLSQYNLTGQNAILGSQLFQYSFQSGTTTQKTNNAVAGTNVTNLELSPDGSRLFFLTAIDLVNNPSRALPAVNIFEVNTANNAVSQRTNFSSNPSVTVVTGFSTDGNSFLTGSTVNLTGGNPDGSTELYVFDISADPLSFGISTGSGVQGRLNLLLDEVDGVLRGLGGHQLTTQSAALGALDAAKLNITKLNKLQGTLGSSMSRLEYASSVASTSVLATDSARSRITDADVAEEAALLARSQVLQQAGSAILAQANIQPSIALQLLRFNGEE